MLQQILIPSKKNLITLYTISILSWIISIIISYIFQGEEILRLIMICAINTGTEIYCLSSSLTNAYSCQDPELREQYIALSTMITNYWKVGTLVFLSTVLMMLITRDIRVTNVLIILAPWAIWYYILKIRGFITSCRLPDEF